jgi:segregation and condensation protein B
VNAALLAALEGILFVAERALSLADLAAALDGEVDEARLRAAMEVLQARHPDTPDRGFALVRSGDRWQLRTTAQAGSHVARFVGRKPTRLSRASLETLAIVAYRQPCTRADIERIRGVDSGGVVRALLDRKLIGIAGRRAEPGRPMVYRTTGSFLEQFGLSSIADLPSLREFTELGPEDALALPGEPDSDKGQLTLQEYAARRAIEHLDEEVDRRLRARATDTSASPSLQKAEESPDEA